jgi:hypothetical protein
MGEADHSSAAVKFIFWLGDQFFGWMRIESGVSFLVSFLVGL